MTTQTEATYIQGVLHPDTPLPLPDGSRVSLQVESPINSGVGETQPDVFQEFLDFRERHPVNLGGEKFNREDLYDCG